jgi:hypothetical protein
MKKIFSLILGALLVLVLVGPAAAGPQDVLSLGTAQIQRADLEQLKSMVAGTYRPAAPVARMAEPDVDLGVVALSRQDLAQLQSMVAGTYVPPPNAALAAGQEWVDVGRVMISRSAYESIKRQVAERLHDASLLTASATGLRRP